jgi:hypothetical protein
VEARNQDEQGDVVAFLLPAASARHSDGRLCKAAKRPSCSFTRVPSRRPNEPPVSTGLRMGTRKIGEGNVHAVCPAPLDFTAKDHRLHSNATLDKTLRLIWIDVNQRSLGLTECEKKQKGHRPSVYRPFSPSVWRCAHGRRSRWHRNSEGLSRRIAVCKGC